MDEEEAREWLRTRADVSRETFALLERFVALLLDESEKQNLVSRGSISSLWSRHIVDSLQLLDHAGPSGAWVDLGTGAGFPGLIISLMRSHPMTLVEGRKLRAGFLEHVTENLGIANRVEVVCADVARVRRPPFAIISARAFAPLDPLFGIAAHLATDNTRWILPKGRNAKTELEAARASWQGVFRLEPSLTDEDAWIIVAEQVRSRARGRETL